MKHLRITSCALAAVCVAHSVAAAPAGTLLFTQPGTQIVNSSGTARPAAKGDVLQTGESLLTPAGAISQVLLTDGTLIGMRPASELKIDAGAAGSDGKWSVVNLVNGSARIIGAELMDTKKASNFTLQSGNATVKLKGADMESAVVKADGRSAAGDTAPGSYQRLLVGAGTITNGSQTAALAPKQVSDSGATNTAPVTVAAPSQNLFGSNTRGTGQQPGGSGATDSRGTTGNNNATTPMRLVNGLTLLRPMNPATPGAQPVPAVAPTVRPCTRFIGKTCIQ